MKPNVTSNVFLALAEAMWKRGEDGEVIAKELIEATFAVIKEGKGYSEFRDIIHEIGRLSQ